jgi:hypothetical protein
MGILELKYLEDWFEDIAKINIDLSIALNNMKELNKRTDNEELELVKSLGFFVHHQYQLRFIVIIQLSKLFSDSHQQKRRIKELISRLRNDEFDEDLLKLIKENESITCFKIGDKVLPRVFKSREDINIQIKLFSQKLKEHKKIIDKVEKARNKIYAHSDPEIDTFIPFISLKEIEELTNLSCEFYNIFRGGLFNAHTTFNIPECEIKNILAKLARKHKAGTD